MSKLIILTGLPGSGKTTRAKELLIEYGNAVRINRDELRVMLHTGQWSGRKEGTTRQAARVLALAMLQETGCVIIDDTNLAEGTVQMWKMLAQDAKATVEIMRMETSLAECVRRDATREHSVGRHVIVGMALQHKLVPKPTCGFVLCDIDGTLADCTHRLHYLQHEPKDWTGFFDAMMSDTVRFEVLDQVYALHRQGHEVFFVSGRPDSHRDFTEEWLETRCGWPEPVVFMRRSGDHRPDVLVKQQMLDTYFSDRSWIHLVIDDRKSVIAIWREAGLTVIDVGTGEDF